MKVKTKPVYKVVMNDTETNHIAHMIAYALTVTMWSGDAHKEGLQFIEQTIGISNIRVEPTRRKLQEYLEKLA